MSYGRPSIDLESYAALYHGRSKIRRLQHISRTSSQLEVDALILAIREAKRGRDTVLYKSLVSQLAGRGGDTGVLDEQWVACQDSWASKELDKLRSELEMIKEQNSKEAVRTAYTDLGDFYHARGKLQQARGEYLKSRDYCALPLHTLQVCLRTIIVCIEGADFINVENYHHMAESSLPDQTPSPAPASSSVGAARVPARSADLALVRASSALSLLVRERYKDAAWRFLSVSIDPSEDRTAALQAHFGEPLSLEDVATLGTLCALATLDRAELKSKVLDKPAFRSLLELVPDMRELISDFYASRYTKCFDTLEKLKPDLVLDLHVGSDGHIDQLYSMIRQEALVQYVSPFLTADLARMEKVFKTTGPKLENELYQLIESGAIPARIDMQKRALYRKVDQTQAQALEEAVERGQEAFNDVEAMFLRMSLVKSGLTLPVMAPNTRVGSLLGSRTGSINSIADSGYERFGGT